MNYLKLLANLTLLITNVSCAPSGTNHELADFNPSEAEHTPLDAVACAGELNTVLRFQQDLNPQQLGHGQTKELTTTDDSLVGEMRKQADGVTVYSLLPNPYCHLTVRLPSAQPTQPELLFGNQVAFECEGQVSPKTTSCVVLPSSLLERGIHTVDERYFATPDIQALRPNAFALQPEANEFLDALEAREFAEENALVSAIQQNRTLISQVERFPELDWEEKEILLRNVFELEVQTLGITAPNLVIRSGSIPGAAFYEFELDEETPGTVYLNPEKIVEDDNPYLALLLLIHETRHSAQLQWSHRSSDPLGSGYGHAFAAQKDLEIKTFSDFLTLLNEYEAFRFSNYVVGRLTNWQVSTQGLGTYASQFDSAGQAKINLRSFIDQHRRSQSELNLLQGFNVLEFAQYYALKAE